jgi:hypothetical protein
MGEQRFNAQIQVVLIVFLVIVVCFENETSSSHLTRSGPVLPCKQYTGRHNKEESGHRHNQCERRMAPLLLNAHAVPILPWAGVRTPHDNIAHFKRTKVFCTGVKTSRCARSCRTKSTLQRATYFCFTILTATGRVTGVQLTERTNSGVYKKSGITRIHTMIENTIFRPSRSSCAPPPKKS